MKRNFKTKELYLNFNSEVSELEHNGERNYSSELCFQLSAILREVHYLKLMDHEGIPEVALKMSERNEVFRKYITNLNCTIEWYNKIRRSSREVEFQLIENEIEDIDKLIAQGQNLLNWNSQGTARETIYAPF